jgi:hypothetical protein
VVALAIISALRLAAISDARSDAELSEWLAVSPLVEHRSAGVQAVPERLRAKYQRDLRKAAG